MSETLLVFLVIFIPVVLLLSYVFVDSGKRVDPKTGKKIKRGDIFIIPEDEKEIEIKKLDPNRFDSKIAKIIRKEIDDQNFEDVTWLKAFKKARGNKQEAQALYAEYRTEELERVYYLKNDTSDNVNVNKKINYDSKKITKSKDNLDKNQLNILLFSIIYFFSFFLGYYLIDLDLNFQNLLGHRSIITHSILIPWLIYFYSKDKTSKYFFTIIMGLFISCSVHLINDLIPKGWSGYAFIKLPGNISLGFLSIPWIFLNALVAMYLGQKILFNYFSETKYKVLIIIITIITSFLFALNDRNDEMLKFILFLIVFFSFYFYQRVRTLPLA